MLNRPIRKVKEVFRLLLVAPLLVSSASAQKPTCTVKLDQLPESIELRGFRLGMTFEQAKASVPQIQLVRPDEFGVARTSINPYFDPSFDRTRFADVRTISLGFLDGTLASLWIGYESTFKWQNLDVFIAGISKSLNLPAEWPPAKRGGRQLKCDGFSVFASEIAGSPSVRISDDNAQETLATRREEAAAAADLVIGDQRTKLYYPSDCEALTKVTEANRIKFKDKQEAEAASYKPAPGCE